MRFRVEITPLGGEHSGSSNFALAGNWQGALSEVRELRREAGAEEALSFEALGDDAHRIIDVGRRLRYVVEPAIEEGNHYASFELLSARDVEPSEEAPYGYRERAVRLTGEVSRERARQVLEALLEVVRAELIDAPFGQVIELGAFADGASVLSAPIATLSFKDWRGEMDFWFADGLAETAPSPAAPPARPLLATKAKTKPPRPASDPVSSRRPHEDLTFDLFGMLHQLDFAPDIPSGVAFVQDVLAALLPGRVSAVHVFDIDTRNFVLVGVRGLPPSLVGSRLPDGDPFFRFVLQKQRAQRLEGAEVGPLQLRGHFLEEPPGRLMASPVLCEGRDLGVIEVGDPEGPEPYSETEAAALDYIALRFAEFLAHRPIVLDAELFGR